jgi:hypothetical protein
VGRQAQPGRGECAARHRPPVHGAASARNVLRSALCAVRGAAGSFQPPAVGSFSAIGAIFWPM